MTQVSNVVIFNEVLLCRDDNRSIHNQDFNSIYKLSMSIFKQVAIDCTPRSNNCQVLIKKNC